MEQTAKPREGEINEKLEEYRKAGLDDHSIFIHRVQMGQRMQKDDAPAIMGRRNAARTIRH